MTTQYLWLIILSVAIYFIVTDESIAALFYYVIKLGKIEIDKQIWWLLNNPRNPVVKYLIYRRSLKISKNLMAEINKNKEI